MLDVPFSLSPNSLTFVAPFAAVSSVSVQPPAAAERSVLLAGAGQPMVSVTLTFCGLFVASADETLIVPL